MGKRNKRVQSQATRRRRRRAIEPLESRQLLAVDFQFNFVNAPGTADDVGFNDSNPTVRDGYRQAVIAAGQRIGGWLTHTATIQLDVFSTAGPTPSSFGAEATSEPRLNIPVTFAGFAKGVIQAKIQDGTDHNAATPDGKVFVTFPSDTSQFTLETNPLSVGSTSISQIDFQAVIIHELTHALGFASFISPSGVDKVFGTGVTEGGVYLPYDQFISDINGNRFINPNTGMINQAAWLTHSVGGPGPNNGLFFDGPNAKAANNGNRVPLFSANPFSTASQTGHLDSEGSTLAVNGTVSGGLFSPRDHLMTHNTIPGARPQEWSLLEKAMLQDIGYVMAVPRTLTPPQAITLEANAQVGFTGTNATLQAFLSGAVASNPQDNPVITQNAPASFPLGSTTVQFTATYSDQVEVSASAAVIVVDTTAPSITIAAPTTVTLEATGPGGVSKTALPFQVTATDIVDSNPSITSNASAMIALGTNQTIIYTARDASNNTATAQAMVSVVDTMPPTLNALGSIEIRANAGGSANINNATLLAYVNANASDLVDQSLTFFAEPSIIPQGTSTVTITARDDAGNSSQADVIVTVTDSADFIVDTNLDLVDPNDGKLSLREAINAANAQAGLQEIAFASSITGPILLLGELQITDSVTIQGLGQSTTVIDAQQMSRVINVEGDSIDVTLEGVTLRNGRTTESNAFVNGALVPTHSGGGIRFLSGGTLTLTSSTLSGNRTEGERAYGGGIFTRSGAISLTNSTVSGNSTTGLRADGGGIYSSSGAVMLTNSTVTGNSTESDNAFGGGISTGTGPVTLTSSTVSGNSTAGEGAVGGGIKTGSGHITLTRSTVSGNSTTGDRADGGGVFTGGGYVTLLNSTVSGNRTEGNDADGGGLLSRNSRFQIVHSTISGNRSARDGGGMMAASYGASITVIGSTISGNMATRNGGGIYGNERELSLNHVTVTNNIAGGIGGGIHGLQGPNTLANRVIVIRNSIVAGNTAGNAPDVAQPVPVGSNDRLIILSSLIGDNSNQSGGVVEPASLTKDSASGNIVGTAHSKIDPKLGPLAFNGGTTQTHALLVGSPAIEAGDNSTAAKDVLDVDGDGNFDEPLPVDQRGRPFGRFEDGISDGSFTSAMDMGAYERQAVRGLPSPLVVTTVDDELDENPLGDLSDLSDLSLREAIGLANGSIGADTIVFDASVTDRILLKLGELQITDSLTITGLGIGASVVDAGGKSRIFNIEGDSIDVTFVGLTITGGSTTADNDPAQGESTHSSGGGIRFVTTGNPLTTANLLINDSQLTENKTQGEIASGGAIFVDRVNVTLQNSRISGNSTSGFNSLGGAIANIHGNVTLNGSLMQGNGTLGAFAPGGGIYTAFGAVTLNDSSLSNNYTTGNNASGGGVHTTFGSVTLNQSTLSNNYLEGEDSKGGGISTQSGAVMLNRSTVSGNRTDGLNGAGGGISTLSGNVVAVNSTIANNRTQQLYGFGGGVYSLNGNVTLTNSTITGNRISPINTVGGGVRARNGFLTINNSIIVGNTGRLADLSPSSHAEITVKNSLIGSSAGTGLEDSSVPDSNGNLVGIDWTTVLASHTVEGIVVPLLADNGGPTQTIALLPGSESTPNPAIDAGDNTLAKDPDGNDLTTDGRGAPFNRVSGSLVDMGAYEFQTLAPSFFVVTTNVDELDYSNNTVSLREAINSANDSVGADTITFASSVTNPILLSLGQLEITDNVTIQGLGQSTTVIDAQQMSRVINVEGDSIDVTLEGVTLRNGRTTGSNAIVNGALESTHSGGGIRFLSGGTLTLTGSTVSGNRTEGDFAFGGVIYSSSGAVTLTDSTISGNSTAGERADGGGIHAGSGAVTLSGSTVSGNSTAGDSARAGGIFASSGAVTLSGSTVSGNSTAGEYASGGGIFASSGAVTLSGSTVSGNSTAGEYAYGGGIFASSGAVTLSGSTVSGNRTEGEYAYGGGIFASSGAVTLSGSTVSGNSTEGDRARGGGIYARSGAVTQTDSTVSGNSTAGESADGGGIFANSGVVTLSGSTVSGNRTEGDRASGGGIFANSGVVTLSGSTVSGNRTEGDGASGGGIYARSGAVTLTGSTVSGNSTAGEYAYGGGIFTRSGAVTLSGSTVSGNSTAGEYGSGGGIFASSNAVTLTGSTVSGNRVTGADSDGGGVWFDDAVVTIVNSTITGNSATRAGGGLGMLADSYDKKLTIHNSIIAGNKAPTNPDFTAPNAAATNLEVGSSLIGNNQGTTLTDSSTPDSNGNLVGIDWTTVLASHTVDGTVVPLLADNGGPTQTVALIAGSPAIDAGKRTFTPLDATVLWRFEVESGDTVDNIASSTQPQLTLHNTPKLDQVGPIGNGSAIGFDGDDDYATASVSSAQLSGNQYSIGFWVRVDEAANTQSLFALTAAGADHGHALLVEYEPFAGGRLRLLSRLPAGNADGVNVRVPFQVGQWHHVAAARDGEDIRVYVDGVLAGSVAGATTNSLPTDGLTVTLGRLGPTEPLNQRHLSGAIDELVIFDRAITSTEALLIAAALRPDFDQRGYARTAGLTSIDDAPDSDGTDIGALEMVGVSISDATVSESAGNVTVTVTLSHPIPDGQTLTAVVTTAVDGSAQQSDFTALIQTVEFVGGDSLTQTIIIPINDDDLVETDETFSVILESAMAVVEQAAATVTITSEDVAIDPTISWSLPQPIVFGTTLSSTQLNATADVPGTFVYNPAAGTILTVGDGQTLSVTFTPADTVNYNTVDAAVQIDVLQVIPTLDFGDAPASFPVASHIVGSLFLGAGVTAEFEGTLSTTASSDSNDDGITLLATAIAASTPTRSSLAVVASAAGKLDAWIDFNGNGSWQAGEQIFDSVNVAAGANTLSYLIPAGASVGGNAARFRLSSAGNLDVTGAASDGEVEDYIMTIEAAATINNVTVTSISPGTVTIEPVDTDVIVREGSKILFQGPAASLALLDFTGTSGNDTINLTTNFVDFTSGMSVDAGTGIDTVIFDQVNSTLDLSTGSSVALTGVEVLDIRGTHQNSLKLDAAAIGQLADDDRIPRVLANPMDIIEIVDGGFVISGALVETGQFVVQLRSTPTDGGAATRLEVVGKRWTNPIDPTDVTGTDGTTATDALRIINQLNSPDVFDPETGVLQDPATVEPSSVFSFFDVSGDGILTAVDALQVINRLNELDISSEPFETRQLAPQQNVVPPATSVILDQVNHLVVEIDWSSLEDDLELLVADQQQLSAHPRKVDIVDKRKSSSGDEDDWDSRFNRTLSESLVDLSKFDFNNQ
jgi:CSLREA domain-containing protein